MNKRDFIQKASVMYTLHPKSPDADTAIRWAVVMWEKLTEAGYGASKPHKPRESKDYYGLLTSYQKEHFNTFWDAFKYKTGRNEAAMTWAKLGEPAKVEYEKIILAAKLEAKARADKKAQGITPIMAQGWLSAMRYNDVSPKKLVTPQQKQNQQRVRELMIDLAHYKKQAETGDEFSAEQARLVSFQLKELGVNNV